MNKRYVVRLEPEERGSLERLVNTGKTAAYKIKHAHILLKADADGPAWTDGQIAEAFGCHARTVENVRRRFVTDGTAAALERKKRDHPPREKVLDGEAEAHLIAVACSEPPEGRARWTLELLADKLVELNIVESVSYQTVRRALKKTGFSLTAADVG
jgi:transposase